MDSTFQYYEDALRVLAGPALSPGVKLSVFEVVPRPRGPLVGFHAVDFAGQDALYYVEPVSASSGAFAGLSTTLTPGGVALVAWRYPADPRLPALATVVYPDACSILLERIGRSPSVSDVSLVGYRPGRRAVVRVTTSDEVIWVKVVRPEKVNDIVSRHTRVRDGAVPTPRLVTSSSAGLLVFETAAGVPLVEAESIGMDPRLVAERILDVHTLMSRVDGVDVARAPMVDSCDWYVDQAVALLPELGDALAELRRGVDRFREIKDRGQLSTVHGDLHAGQIFVDPDWPHPVTSVIDLDGCGVGWPVDDTAAACAHSLATAVLHGNPDSTQFWIQVSDHLDASVSTRDRHRPRFQAGVLTHLVGHALGAHASGRGDPAALLHASQQFL